MRVVFYFLFLFSCVAVLLLALAAPARAQDTEQASQPPAVFNPSNNYYNYAAGPYYRQMVMQALATRPSNFDFTAFRSLYAQYADYDPLSAFTKNFLLDKAFFITQEKNKAKREQMLADYGDMVVRHLGNIDIVNQALSLARQDARFGDPSFYEWLQAGLLRSILGSGSGESLTRAYEITSMGEETALLNALQVRVLQTLTRESGGVYYNIHDVQAYDTGAKRSIFTNISIPMTTLTARRETEGLAVDIRTR
jgi:hypothetical protein